MIYIFICLVLVCAWISRVCCSSGCIPAVRAAAPAAPLSIYLCIYLYIHTHIFMYIYNKYIYISIYYIYLYMYVYIYNAYISIHMYVPGSRGCAAARDACPPCVPPRPPHPWHTPPTPRAPRPPPAPFPKARAPRVTAPAGCLIKPVIVWLYRRLYHTFLGVI